MSGMSDEEWGFAQCSVLQGRSPLDGQIRRMSWKSDQFKSAQRNIVPSPVLRIRGIPCRSSLPGASAAD